MKNLKYLLILSLLATEFGIVIAEAQSVPTGRRLRTIVNERFTPGSFYIGSTMKPGSFATESDVIVSREYNYTNGANGHKQSQIHPEPGVWTWTDSDYIVNTAKDNNQTVRLHAPTGPQHSTWAADPSRTVAELRTNMTEYIQGVIGRYAADTHVQWMDVVNETAINGGWRDDTNKCPWFILGQEANPEATPTYIKEAFQIATAAAPAHLKLLWAQNRRFEDDPNQWELIKQSILYLRSIGCRVDGIAWQAHIFPDWEDQINPFNSKNTLVALNELIDWCQAQTPPLEFHVSENDVRYTYSPLNAAELQNQADTYVAVANAVIQKLGPAPMSVNFWLTVDAQSGNYPTHNARLYDDNYAAKTAYYDIQALLEANGNDPIPLPANAPEWIADPLVMPAIDAYQNYGTNSTPYALAKHRLNDRVEAWDPEGDTITFSKISGPAWLSLTSDGYISGRPDNSDAVTNPNVFVIRADDGNGNTTDVSMQITVNSVTNVNNAWQLPYTGNSPDTRFIWHMDNNEMGTGTAQVDLKDDMTTAPAGGKFGQGISGDGTTGLTGDRAIIQDSDTPGAIFPAGADPSFSIEGWFRFNDLSVDQRLIKKQLDTNNNVIDLRYVNATDTLRLDIGSPVNSGSNRIEITPAGLSTGTWYHIAATWDASTDTMKLFVDGNETGSSTATGLMVPDVATDLLVGGTVSNPFDGDIDEVRISDAAISYIIPLPGNPVWAYDPITQSDAATGLAYSDSVTDGVDVLDPESDTLTFSIQSGPAWLTVDSNTGALSGTPGIGDVGLNSFVMRADDGNGNTSDTTIEILVVEVTTNWVLPYSGNDPSTLWIWHMDDDEIGSNTGQLQLYNDAATAPAGGKFGQGITGDGTAGAGTGDRLTVRNAETNGAVVPSTTDQSFTLEGWFKLNDVSSPNEASFFKKDGTEDAFKLEYINATGQDTLRFEVGQPGTHDFNTVNNRLNVTPSGLVSGQWHHLAVTWDHATQTMKMYRDGTEIGSNTPSSAISFTDTGTPAAIKLIFSGSTSRPLNGAVDEIRYSDKALVFAQPGPGVPLWAADPLIKSNAYSGADYSDAITANLDVWDPENDALTYTKTSGPTWLSIDLNSGALTGVPSGTDLGVNNFTVSADDGNGNVVQTTLKITVSEANTAWNLPYTGSSANTLWVWHMDNNEFGNTNTGELDLFGDAAANPAGKFGQGVIGDGITGNTSDRVQVTGSDTPGAVYPATPDPSFTIEGWFNLNSLASDVTFFKKQLDGLNNVFQIKYLNASDTIRFDLGSPPNTGGNRVDITPSGLSTGTWLHLAATWDAVTDTMKLFLNGSEIGSSVATGLMVPDVATTLLFGGTSGNPIDGSVDEVRLSDKAYNFAIPANAIPYWADAPPALKANATESSPYTGQSVIVNIDVIDPESDTLTYTKISGPAWLSIDLNSGALTGTPGAGDVGSNTFVIRASDGSNFANGTIEITVDAVADPYTVWELAEFGTSGVNTRLLDADVDGYTNEEEYYFGMDPQDAVNQTGNKKHPEGSVVTDSGNLYPGITYSYRNDNPSITYTIETSTNLSTWIDSTASMVQMGSITDNGDGTNTRTLRYNQDFTTTSKLFLRVKAEE